MRILVTGATGFLGRATALRLHADGHQVTALGRNRAVGEALAALGPAFVAADLADAEAIAQACRHQDAVVHSGAISSIWGPYEDFHRTNVLGTRHVVAGCQSHGVKRLVNISSPTVYFDFTDRYNLREDAPLPRRGVNAYAVTKLLAEAEVAAGARQGLETVNLRPRGIFGPGDTAILPRLIRANERGLLPLIGREDPTLDLTYVDNVVDAIVTALTAPDAVGRTYNLTNGTPIKLWQTLDRIFTLLEVPMHGKRMSYRGAYAAAWAMELAARATSGREPVLTRYTVGVLSKSMTLDIGAARRDLDYAPRIDMEAGMARFVAWWREAQRSNA